MPSFNRNRPFVFGGAIFLFILVLWALLGSRRVQIGDFTMPSLSGWTRTVERTPRNHRVIYKKDDGRSSTHINFSWRLDRATNAPKTTQALAAEATRDFAQSASMMQAGGLKFQYGSPQQKTIKGMPAVETPTLVTGGSKTTYGRAISFVDGSHLYNLYATINVPSTLVPTPPADLTAQRDEALNAIIETLTPSS